jgi:hypothetical protein
MNYRPWLCKIASLGREQLIMAQGNKHLYYQLRSSGVPDPDTVKYVFRPPGSGSFHQHANKLRKTLILAESDFED